MPITALSEFIELTDQFQSLSNIVLFRGQSAKGKLLPGIARDHPEYDSTNLERTLLTQFRLLGASYLSGMDRTTLELMVVAQHFGLKTRLLDWTRNPLVALYFACANGTDADAYVYFLEADNFVDTDLYDKDPFTISKTRAFQPPLNNPRILAQQGWFTLHCYDQKNERFDDLDKKTSAPGKPYEVLIPGSMKASLLKSLSQHGIAVNTLFPDLGGVSRHLNEAYALPI